MATKNKFFTQYDKKPTIKSKPGEKEIIIYEEQIKKDGTTGLVEAGRKNLYAEVQMCKESCDLNTLWEKYQRTGDESFLKRATTFYADVSEAPKNLIEAQNQMNKINTFFERLPSQIKTLFDNSTNKFITQMNSGEAQAKIEAWENSKKSPASQPGQKNEEVKK